MYEIALGYVNCDICGNGTNMISIYRDYGKPQSEGWTYELKSNCYDDRRVSDVSPAQIVKEMHKDYYLVCTRSARRNFRATNNALLDRQKRIDAESSIVEEDEPIAPAPQYLGSIDDIFNDRVSSAREGCNDPECMTCRGGYF